MKRAIMYFTLGFCAVGGPNNRDPLRVRYMRKGLTMSARQDGEGYPASANVVENALCATEIVAGERMAGTEGLA